METNLNIDKFQEILLAYLPKVVGGILLLIIGLWVIKKVVKVLDKMMEQRGMDLSLRKFLSSVLGAFLKIMLFLAALGMFGIETTSFIAIFGALMVGVGMALNGTIGHFASGVMLMIFKPFIAGDLVTIGGGQTGTVEAINAFNTTLATLDNKRIIIANSNVTGNDIINISGQGIVGVELAYDIGYTDNIAKAREVILRVGSECPYILDDPAQGVVVAELKDSAIQLNSRPFCKSEHYWDTKFYMQENVKLALDAAGISIPFAQLDVNMIPQN